MALDLDLLGCCYPGIQSIPKAVQVEPDEQHTITIPGWQKNTFFLLIPDQRQRKKYETVYGIIIDAGLRDSDCFRMQKDILAMINKGMVPKEIGNTIQENLRDEEGGKEDEDNEQGE